MCFRKLRKTSRSTAKQIQMGLVNESIQAVQFIRTYELCMVSVVVIITALLLLLHSNKMVPYNISVMSTCNVHWLVLIFPCACIAWQFGVPSPSRSPAAIGWWTTAVGELCTLHLLCFMLGQCLPGGWPCQALPSSNRLAGALVSQKTEQLPRLVLRPLT